jgi:hypothetical protein
MNYQVDEEGQLPSQVARDFLMEAGLVRKGGDLHGHSKVIKG